MNCRSTIFGILFACAVLAYGCAPETPIYPTPPSPQPGRPAVLELSASPMVGFNTGRATIATRVLDAYANPVKDTAVTLETTSGSISPSTIVSDESGRGTAILTAARGTVKVTASVGPSLTMSTLVSIQ